MKYEEKFEKTLSGTQVVRYCLLNVLEIVDQEIDFKERIKQLPMSISSEIVEIYTQYLGRMMINFDRGENMLPKRFFKALDASPELTELPKDKYLWEDDEPDTPCQIGGRLIGLIQDNWAKNMVQVLSDPSEQLRQEAQKVFEASQSQAEALRKKKTKTKVAERSTNTRVSGNRENINREKKTTSRSAASKTWTSANWTC